ncbi:MAG: hypothetical protein HUJ27_07765 [Rhodobacteraceae bacterium]|nr:hypothetical protein [Paracoccaceae bacterium]
MDKLQAILELRSMLQEMEQDLGLHDLSAAERDIFLAARGLTKNPGDVIRSDEIRSHKLIQSIAQATYHRSLRALVDKGLLRRAEGSKAKSYVLCSEKIEE